MKEDCIHDNIVTNCDRETTISSIRSVNIYKIQTFFIVFQNIFFYLFLIFNFNRLMKNLI